MALQTRGSLTRQWLPLLLEQLQIGHQTPNQLVLGLRQMLLKRRSRNLLGLSYLLDVHLPWETEVSKEIGRQQSFYLLARQTRKEVIDGHRHQAAQISFDRRLV